MATDEQRKKGNKGAARTELVAVRFDPRTKYLMELAARSQRRSIANYVEWAVESSLKNVFLDLEGRTTAADAAPLLWFLGEPARLARLSAMYPHLLDTNEQRLVRAAREATRILGGAPRAGRDDREQLEFESDLLRPYWDYLKSSSERDVPLEQILSGVVTIQKEVNGTGPMTEERIATARAKAVAEYEKKCAAIDAAEQELLAAKSK